MHDALAIDVGDAHDLPPMTCRASGAGSASVAVDLALRRDPQRVRVAVMVVLPFALSLRVEVEKMATILHLSDVHYGKQAFSTSPAPEGYQRSFDASLIAALGERKPDWIVVSGDISQRAAPGEFSAAATEILRLATHLRVPPHRLVLCPGNHDVDWSVTDAGGPNAEVAKLDAYRAFLEQIYGAVAVRTHYRGYPSSLVGVHDDPASGICIVSVASCLAERRESPFGYVGGVQLEAAKLAFSATSSPLKIVVMHHHGLLSPADVLVSPDASGVRPRAGVVTQLDLSIARDAGLLLREFGSVGVRVLLHGHKHDPQLRSYRDLSVAGSSIACFGAGSAAVASSELPPGRRHHAYLMSFSGGTPRVANLEAVDGTWTIGAEQSLIGLYDEVESLLARLSKERVSRGASPELAVLLRKYVEAFGASPGTPELFMTQLEGMPIMKDGWADKVFWKLVIVGFFEFFSIDQFYSGNGDSWEQGVDFVRLAHRGEMLLHRLLRA